MTPERIYASLLLMYPVAFRREYGGEMIAAFRELERANRGGRMAFWAFVTVDVCCSALQQHLLDGRENLRSVGVQWTMACAAGAMGAGLVANALTWTFRYFYHPYFEGIALPVWSYGALIGLGLGAAQSLVLRRRLHAGAAWIVATTAGSAVGLFVAVPVASLAGIGGYGVVLGGVVGMSQWLVLRTRVRRAGRWVLASAAALLVAVLSCAATMHAALQGLNPLSSVPFAIEPLVSDAAVRWLARQFEVPHGGADLAAQLALMAIFGGIIAAVTARPLASMLERTR